jgi:hypothetical protein
MKTFEAMKDMQLFNPMTGEPLSTANPKLLAVAQRSIRVKRLLSIVKQLYKNVELIEYEITDTVKSYFNISFEKFEIDDLPTYLDIIASTLEHKNKYPVKIFQNKNQIIIEVN